jgi:hypothetical protein
MVCGQMNAYSDLHNGWCCIYQSAVLCWPHGVILRLSAVPVILQCHSNVLDWDIVLLSICTISATDFPSFMYYFLLDILCCVEAPSYTSFTIQ